MSSSRPPGWRSSRTSANVRSRSRGRSGRAAEGGGLENRWSERARRFESCLLRLRSLAAPRERRRGMQRSAKRKLGIAAAVASLLAAGLSSSAIHRLHEGGLRTLSAHLAGNEASLAQAAFEARLRMIESQAQAAAQLPQIRGQITTFDAATLKDGFRSEAWWAPFRLDFSVYGVATDGPGLSAVEGMNAAEVDAAPLVAEAREKRQASGLILAG